MNDSDGICVPKPELGNEKNWSLGTRKNWSLGTRGLGIWKTSIRLLAPKLQLGSHLNPPPDGRKYCYLSF
jgi:hypothetical protein